jgi:hypothetical protein
MHVKSANHAAHLSCISGGNIKDHSRRLANHPPPLPPPPTNPLQHQLPLTHHPLTRTLREWKSRILYVFFVFPNLRGCCIILLQVRLYDMHRMSLYPTVTPPSPNTPFLTSISCYTRRPYLILLVPFFLGDSFQTLVSWHLYTHTVSTSIPPPPPPPPYMQLLLSNNFHM